MLWHMAASSRYAEIRSMVMDRARRRIRHTTGPNAWSFPEWWGVESANSGADSTLAVQFALDSGFPVRFNQNYNVERVTITGGQLLDGQNTATTSTSLHLLPFAQIQRDARVPCT